MITLCCFTYNTESKVWSCITFQKADKKDQDYQLHHSIGGLRETYLYFLRCQCE